MSAEILPFIFLVLGIVVGALVTWLVAKNRFGRNTLLPSEISQQYVRCEVHEQLQAQADVLRDDLKESEKEIRILEQSLAARQQDVLHLEEKLNTQLTDFQQLQQQSKTEFTNIANRLLEEKSEKFTAQNQRQLQDTLQPLRTKIQEFEQGIAQKFLDEAKDKSALKEQIKQLAELNQQLSNDAHNLTSALKGGQKTQGDWGELQLETLLQKAGLSNGIEYQKQSNFKDEKGKDKRPDFIINLPDNKHLIIDSKVSLTAYERFFNAENETEQKQHLKAHIASLQQHIRDLSSKNYQLLYQINSPDYLLLFVPIEPALSCALREDNSLFVNALERNIVIVSTSTLLATLRTVAYIWKQEKQKKNVLAIARQSGLLYDRFVNFVDDLKLIGTRLDSAQSAYHDAFRKLKEGKKYGDTLIGRAERIKQLGAKTSKQLPLELLEEEE